FDDFVRTETQRLIQRELRSCTSRKWVDLMAEQNQNQQIPNARKYCSHHRSTFTCLRFGPHHHTLLALSTLIPTNLMQELHRFYHLKTTNRPSNLRFSPKRRDEFDNAHVAPTLPFHRTQAIVAGVDPLRYEIIGQRPERNADRLLILV